jgi:hypothetical protein
MTYIVRTIDRCFTEAQYSCFSEMVRDWKNEIMSGTHYFMIAID